MSAVAGKLRHILSGIGLRCSPQGQNSLVNRLVPIGKNADGCLFRLFRHGGKDRGGNLVCIRPRQANDTDCGIAVGSRYGGNGAHGQIKLLSGENVNMPQDRAHPSGWRGKRERVTLSRLSPFEDPSSGGNRWS
ncbi:hypothetical protein SDC9_102883 [bioreactor metagenome]|uniref:Uncharacterized protein n=1 Tax=bioreactor metagenome TaxID=1076179 RepID=A0A645B2Z5_9ZZZZ